jgi:hypothetical protein
VGARCNNWFSSGDLRVYHLVDHFIYRPDAIATITPSTEYSADQAARRTSRRNCQ